MLVNEKYHGEKYRNIFIHTHARCQSIFFFNSITMNNRQMYICLFVFSCRLIHFSRYSSIVMHQLISVNAIILHVSNTEYKQYVSLQLYFWFLFHVCTYVYFFLFLFIFLFFSVFIPFYFDSTTKNRCHSILLAFIEIKYTRMGSIRQ